MRLIDAEELKSKLRWHIRTNPLVNEWIDKMPTVDPVKHEHWVSVDNDGDFPYVCSLCGSKEYNKDGVTLKYYAQAWVKYPYCPVCGAKMDEVEEDD